MSIHAQFDPEKSSLVHYARTQPCSFKFFSQRQPPYLSQSHSCSSLITCGLFSSCLLSWECDGLWAGLLQVSTRMYKPWAPSLSLSVSLYLSGQNEGLGSFILTQYKDAAWPLVSCNRCVGTERMCTQLCVCAPYWRSSQRIISSRLPSAPKGGRDAMHCGRVHRWQPRNQPNGGVEAGCCGNKTCHGSE